MRNLSLVRRAFLEGSKNIMGRLQKQFGVIFHKEFRKAPQVDINLASAAREKESVVLFVETTTLSFSLP